MGPKLYQKLYFMRGQKELSSLLLKIKNGYERHGNFKQELKWCYINFKEEIRPFSG
jgi:hypothetical protein